VPLPSATVPFEAPQQIEGTESSLAKNGIDAGVTLGQQAGMMSGKPVSSAALIGRGNGKERYLIEGEIARGGMGAVLRAVDCDIHREVAVKYMLDAKDPKKQARFVEEAQINGQLEHPNIVPVYDLGIDAKKRPFIMMKMVKGRSLKDVLDQLRDNPRQAEKEWSLGRLLNILVNICNALAFAHSRGVIHRDLKPANIMLGDFGEVYVMDWGLAKVVGRHDPYATTPPPGVIPKVSEPAKTTGKVVTDREEADLTQEGTVLGTPVYMPPEQAAGQIQTMDQRSDVYSVGAILYEILTLKPPVEIDGGMMSVLMRVVQGEIIRPEQREPQRTRAGKIPKELAAVTMKALAKEQKDRYPTVEDLRQDIERFQEGRSVSAKADTNWEIIWKLVKRNKGASAGLAAALLVLVASLVFIFDAWQETRTAQAATLKEQAAALNEQREKEKAQEERRKQMLESLPALVDSARLLANEGKVNEAQRQLALALDYQPANAEAHLLKGQLLVGQKNWQAGQAQLDQYLKLRPNDADARKLVDLCVRGRKEDTAFLVEVAEVFQRQGLYGVAARLFNDVRASVKEREPLLALYRKQIEKAWPGQAERLVLHSDGHFRVNLEGYQEVASLEPLKGIPLDEVNLLGCHRITDLGPLRGMRLTWLQIAGCSQVNDLAPLRGMPLTWLNIYACSQLRDLSPLEGTQLTYLDMGKCKQVQSLAPLKGMPLTFLHLTECDLIGDLNPLVGMPLTYLSIDHCNIVKDLQSLRGMPLSTLYAGVRGPVDFSPLDGMKLNSIFMPGGVSKGMGVLRRIKTLTKIENMPAEDFWKKYDAGEFPQYKP
jgi:serine/threonine protein kinase